MLATAHPPETFELEDALHCLGERLAVLDAADGTLLWRSDDFKAALPAFAPGMRAAAAPGVEGLAEAVAAARAARSAAAITAGERAFDARLAPSEDGRRIYLILEDAAERRAAQQRRLEDRERLLLTSRVISVGEMATMLAHELNQPIGSVVNILRGLKARLARNALTGETAGPAIEMATEQAVYASAVIARVRGFVEQRRPRVEPLDLAVLARRTLDLLDWEIGRDRVSVRVEAMAEPPPVLGDPVMIQQVLVNLARNALDAMRSEAAGRRALTIAIGADAREALLAVKDTGPGLDDEAAARLFEPFYSTKERGMGVGLGVCRSIVELHGGRLWFGRNPEGGAAFHLALPRADLRELSA